MAYIDNYGRPDNPVRDITGSTIGIEALFADHGSPIRTVHVLTPTELQLGVATGALTASDVQQLDTPISQTFDNAWNNELDPSTGKTLHDTVVGLVESGIAQHSPSAYPAYNVSAHAPTTGTLRALVLPPDTAQPTTILLSYQVNGVRGDWTAHNTQNDWFGLFVDATLELTLNVEVLITIQIPPAAGPPFTISASVNINSADISPTNYVGAVETFVGDVFNFFNGQPPIFQSAIGAIDGTTPAFPSTLGSLANAIQDLSKAWSSAYAFGFTALTAFIQPDPTEPSRFQLVLQFAHPQDPAPVPVNAAIPTYPSFHTAAISTLTQAVAGTSVPVQCTQFPLPQATEIHVGWLDTTSGQVTKSFVTWGPANGTQTLSTIPRQGADGKNVYLAQGLTPGTSYTFAVQDLDHYTETPFTTPPVAMSTLSTEQFSLALSVGSQEWPVDSAALTNTGTIDTTANLPSTLLPSSQVGPYTLAANLAGTELARTALEIIAAGGTLPPQIRINNAGIDPSTGQPYPPRLFPGSAMTVQFTAFPAGAIDLYVDSTSGAHIGQTTGSGPATFSATFTWPQNQSSGDHVVWAQSATASAVSAVAPVYADFRPQ